MFEDTNSVILWLICDNSVTIQNLRFFRRTFWKFWSAIMFYESNDNTTALQRRVLQSIPVKSASANVSFYTNNSKMPNFELWPSCRKWALCSVESVNSFPRFRGAFCYRNARNCLPVHTADRYLWSRRRQHCCHNFYRISYDSCMK